jgi:hypothetical protein
MLAGARVDAPAADSRTDALPHDGWQRAEIVFWLTPLAVFGLLPDYLVLGSQIMIAALFALSWASCAAPAGRYSCPFSS